MTSNCLSALIITYNEGANIYKLLSSITWISEVLIVDSGSNDETVAIAQQFNNTRLVYRKFDTFARQCNYGLSCLDSEWILSLDADYVVTQRLADEIQTLIFTTERSRPTGFCGYTIGFLYCVNGKPIRSGLLPPRDCLYKKRYASYVDEGHGHRVVINGPKGKLRNKMLHDDHKPLSVWIDNQKRYQSLEANMLANSNSWELPIQDLIRKHTFLAPFASFFISIVIKGGIFDGKEGLLYAFQRLVAESILYLSMHIKNHDRG